MHFIKLLYLFFLTIGFFFEGVLIPFEIVLISDD